MNKSLKGNKMYLIGLLPFFLIAFLFEILPLANIVIESFSKTGGNGFTLEHFAKIFTTRLYQQSIFNSLWISIFSALAGIIIAFLGAKAANAASAKVRNIFTSVLNITSNFAGVPLAFAFMILLGNVGILTLIGKNYGISFLADFDLYTINGLLTYIYFQIPLATLLMLPIFGGLKKEWREAVGLLGGNSFHYWFKVAIPSLLPSILGTFSVLFANSLAAYGTAYALLSNNIALLPIRISQQYVGEVVQNQEFGCALSLVMMALMVLSILITNKLQNRAGGGMA